MTSITFYPLLLHTVPSIVSQFSAFKTFYADIFHTLPCYVSSHATSKAFNFFDLKNCKSIICRYSFNFLKHSAVRCFVTIGIALKAITIEPLHSNFLLRLLLSVLFLDFFDLRRALLLFNYFKLFYYILTLSFFNTRIISKASFSLTSLL